ncbi:hypothetical protein ACP4OV_025392 [Aristida adscensionis]
MASSPSPLAPTRTFSPPAPRPANPPPRVPPRGASASTAARRRPVRARAGASQGGGSASSSSSAAAAAKTKRCLRCGGAYLEEENHPAACAFHGHVTGEKGLFSLAPPHQGIDGEWSDRSGVIVYRWNDEGSRPNTGRANWGGRWSCCQERDERAPPCRRGRHVSYDDGHTLF